MQAREATAYSADDVGAGDVDARNEMSDLLRPISVICSPHEQRWAKKNVNGPDELTYDASKDVSWGDYFPPPQKTPPVPPVPPVPPLILYLTHDSL